MLAPLYPSNPSLPLVPLETLHQKLFQEHELTSTDKQRKLCDKRAWNEQSRIRVHEHTIEPRILTFQVHHVALVLSFIHNKHIACPCVRVLCVRHGHAVEDAHATHGGPLHFLIASLVSKLARSAQLKRLVLSRKFSTLQV